MVVASRTLTVADVVREFLAVSGYKPKDPFRFLVRVCRRWECLPNYDGTALRAHLLANMGVTLASAVAIQDDAFVDIRGKDGSHWDDAVWQKAVHERASQERKAKKASWLEVGKGTDPIRYLTRPDVRAMRTASIAKQEHYGRR